MLVDIPSGKQPENYENHHVSDFFGVNQRFRHRNKLPVAATANSRGLPFEDLHWCNPDHLGKWSEDSWWAFLCKNNFTGIGFGRYMMLYVGFFSHESWLDLTKTGWWFQPNPNICVKLDHWSQIEWNNKKEILETTNQKMMYKQQSLDTALGMK